MNAIIKAGEMNNLGKQIYRAYYSAVYHGVMAVLSPIVDSTSEVIRESVSRAVREGVKDALKPDIFFGNVHVNNVGDFFRKKKNGLSG